MQEVFEEFLACGADAECLDVLHGSLVVSFEDFAGRLGGVVGGMMRLLAEEVAGEQGVEDCADGPEVDGLGVANIGVGVEEFAGGSLLVADACAVVLL